LRYCARFQLMPPGQNRKALPDKQRHRTDCFSCILWYSSHCLVNYFYMES
jgi:hypothetical protein